VADDVAVGVDEGVGVAAGAGVCAADTLATRTSDANQSIRERSIRTSLEFPPKLKNLLCLPSNYDLKKAAGFCQAVTRAAA
jgi:hypothetical protein